METAATSIKLLVIDIDGTLLNPKGEISPAVLASVQAAQQAGIVVTLATARRYGNTAKIATEAGLVGPLILYDGALIVEHPQASIVYSRTLAADIAQQGVELLARHRIQPVVHPDDGLAEEIWTGPAELDNLWLDAYFATYPERMRRMPCESLCTGHPNPRRVVAFAAEESIAGLIGEVSALHCSWTSIKRGSFGSAELVMMDYGCSKASGVAALADALHIPLSEVMAIGDNNNDITMLQAVGWGVAMGQASEEVKAAAQAVTASNGEDGVAQAIARYALGPAWRASSNSRKRATCL
jgi:hydroxymethylpyrimidine pyrophosphatase-like HAD family hydrolase